MNLQRLNSKQFKSTLAFTLSTYHLKMCVHTPQMYIHTEELLFHLLQDKCLCVRRPKLHHPTWQSHLTADQYAVHYYWYNSVDTSATFICYLNIYGL